MNEFARPLFEDTQHGLAKQILNIAMCESSGNAEAYNYFTNAANFELTIRLYNEFTLESAQEYFDSLA
jgi:hypothetical protein